MTEYEVFRITPEVGEKCYEYAECTHSDTNGRKFTNVIPVYVGRLKRFVIGGYGDNGWRIDYFEDNTGQEHIVYHSYEGTTCFREVACLPAVIPTLESSAAKVVIEHLDCYQLSKDDPRRMVIENNKPPVSKEWIK
jgi:hypothetical protein